MFVLLKHHLWWNAFYLVYCTVRVQWTLSSLVRHFLLCASARLLYCLAGTVGFHAKQATNHIKPIKRRFYLSWIWKLSAIVFNVTIHQVWVQWTFIPWLARIRFSEPLQKQQTKHADATAVVVREENKLSEQSAKLCDHWQSSVHTSFINYEWELCAAYLPVSSRNDRWKYFVAEVEVRKAGLMRTSASG